MIQQSSALFGTVWKDGAWIVRPVTCKVLLPVNKWSQFLWLSVVQKVEAHSRTDWNCQQRIFLPPFIRDNHDFV